MVSSQLLSMLQSLFFIVVGIMGIGFLIGFHELGHFVFCKIFHIRTPSFSIGMGPRIFKKKIGETEFALSLLPLGGYVEIAGAAEVGQGDQKEAHSTDKHSFASKPYYQKMLVMAGGIFFNLIFAYAALSFLYFIGMPKTLLYPLHTSTEISSVEPKTPAAQANLKPLDKLLEIDNQTVNTGSDAIKIVQKIPNKTVHMLIERDGKQEDITIALGSKEINKNEVGFLGVEFFIPKFGFIDSIKNGIQATNFLIGSVIGAFKKLFMGKDLENLGGPLMVISQTIKGAEKGFKIFLLLLAFISVNLAILNIIPLPIMDGGQALFYTIEAILRRPLNEKVREYIHYATWALLLLLVIYLSIKDVIMIFGLKGILSTISTKIKSLITLFWK